MNSSISINNISQGFIFGLFFPNTSVDIDIDYFGSQSLKFVWGNYFQASLVGDHFPAIGSCS